ncbi:YceD family protein [Ferviditalea candida]|uniref:DUF177 domain-containing protein n=1 Tax=Ferviditalea candida TaxID=3108399 RepID=A0ABU5ZG86_9BACL|nr:DUF177 domain-containing protein [Paenibacillaceae bacterium T2]
MHVNLREVGARPEPVELQGQIDISSMLKERRDIIGTDPLQADLRAVQSGELVDVTGRLCTEAEFVCARCLTRFRRKIEIPFHEVFAQTPISSETEDDAGDEEEIHYVSGPKADLIPYLEEHVLLHLPYVPLCDEDCRGLCPQCGSNRNEEECGCVIEHIDPRLAGLKQFFNQENEK